MPTEVQEEQEEKVDHREFAESDRSYALTVDQRGPGADRLLASAQVHASIAIAEQLERLNEGVASIQKQADEQFTWWKRVNR